MNRLFLTLVGTLLTLAGGMAWAQERDAPEPGARPGRGPEFRQRMIEEFDADGDGVLSEEERQTVRETMRERRRSTGDQAGRRPRDAGPEERGPRDPGPEGRGLGRGPGGPPDPNEVFDRFDENGDGMLSREEFRQFAEQQRARRGARGIGGRRPRSAEADASPDRPRPPRQARDFQDRPPLRNPADQPLGPPEGRGPGRGRGRGFDPGPRDQGRGPGDPNAQRGPQAGGMGLARPNLDRIFDRFDENGDDLLSREEFMKLTSTMRERAAQFGRGQGGAGRGRGRGPEEGVRPPRRQRPPLEDENVGDPPAESDIF